MENFSQKLRKLLKDSKMTQEQLAQATGISAAAVSYYIKGVNTPRKATLEKMAEVLGVDAELLGNDMPFCKKLGEKEVRKIKLPIVDIL